MTHRGGESASAYDGDDDQIPRTERFGGSGGGCRRDSSGPILGSGAADTNCRQGVCSPNPVQVGEQITCTIDVAASPNAEASFVNTIDEFPAGITVTEATSLIVFSDGTEIEQDDFCDIRDNRVTCFGIIGEELGVTATTKVTIIATAQQCGAFTNTAEVVDNFDGPSVLFGQDTEQITVCEEPPEPEPDQQQPNQQQGSLAPITQDFEQEAEAGEIDQTFDIS